MHLKTKNLKTKNNFSTGLKPVLFYFSITIILQCFLFAFLIFKETIIHSTIFPTSLNYAKIGDELTSFILILCSGFCSHKEIAKEISKISKNFKSFCY